MSSSTDLCDIMGVTAASSSAAAAAAANTPSATLFQHRHKKSVSKRHDGSSSKKKPARMAREVYNLLCNDKKDGPPLMPSVTVEQDKGYKQLRAKFGSRKVRQWRWAPFRNPGRGDRKHDLVLYHWRRFEDAEAAAAAADVVSDEYEFAKFNVALQAPAIGVEYNDVDYVNHLQSEDWSRMETDHLMDLCARFDLRFYVVHDRWDRATFKKARTIEDLKERYYSIVEKMMRVRELADPDNADPSRKPYVFDTHHEKKRKEQLNKLYSRTAEQIEEEDMLKQELRRIEHRRRERQIKAAAAAAAADAATATAAAAAAVAENVMERESASPHLTQDTNNYDDASPRRAASTERRKAGASASVAVGSSTGTVGVATAAGANSSPASTADRTMSSLASANWVDMCIAAAAHSASSDCAPVITSQICTDTLNQVKKLLDKLDGEQMGIKFADANTVSSAAAASGVTARSTRFKLPASVGLRRTRVLDAVLSRLRVTPAGAWPLAMASANVVNEFNALRSDVATLFDLKAALTAVTSAVVQPAARRCGRSGSPPVAAGRLITVDNSGVSMQADVVDDAHRISDAIDVTGHHHSHHYGQHGASGGGYGASAGASQAANNAAEDDGCTPVRKRKAALEQNNVLKKIRNKQF